MPTPGVHSRAWRTRAEQELTVPTENPVHEDSSTAPPDPAAQRALLVELLRTCKTRTQFLHRAAGRLSLVPACTPTATPQGCDTDWHHDNPDGCCSQPGKLPREKWKAYQTTPPLQAVV